MCLYSWVPIRLGRVGIVRGLGINGGGVENDQNCCRKGYGFLSKIFIVEILQSPSIEQNKAEPYSTCDQRTSGYFLRAGQTSDVAGSS